MAEFGSELREKLSKDKLGSAIEVGGYVIIVLILELVIILIKEDLNICDDLVK
jgi:RTC4-like domain